MDLNRNGGPLTDRRPPNRLAKLWRRLLVRLLLSRSAASVAGADAAGLLWPKSSRDTGNSREPVAWDADESEAPARQRPAGKLVSVARRLECDEDKGRFETKPGKIALAKVTQQER